jgi:hypothetical protein
MELGRSRTRACSVCSATAAATSCVVEPKPPTSATALNCRSAKRVATGGITSKRAPPQRSAIPASRQPIRRARAWLAPPLANCIAWARRSTFARPTAAHGTRRRPARPTAASPCRMGTTTAPFATPGRLSAQGVLCRFAPRIAIAFRGKRAAAQPCVTRPTNVATSAFLARHRAARAAC